MFQLIRSQLTPHEGNDYTPDMLQRGAMVLMLAMAIISFTFSNVYALLWQQSTWLVGAVLPAVVIVETNDERDEVALPPLVRNPVLDAAAKLKAEHMAKNGYFSHYSPDGVSPWYWFQQVDYRFVHAGENLAVHFSDSDEVVEAWMKSPTHRANIVNTSYREIGVGTARGTYEGYDTVFVVQLFGTPAAAATADAGIVVTPVRDVLAVAAPVVVDEAPNEDVAGIEVVAEPVATTPVTSPTPIETVPSTPVPVATYASETMAGATMIYSDTLTTSTNAMPAEVVLTAAPETVNPVASLATSPSRTLQLVYLLLGGLVSIALVASLLIEWRRHRPRQIAYGVGLLGLMSFLFWIHGVVSGGVLII